MDRPRIAAGLVFACLVFPSCSGGGGSSPTAPTPPPESLAGTWEGEISGSAAGGAFTCSLEMDLAEVEEDIFLGSWLGRCSGEEMGGTGVGGSPMGFVFVSGLPSLQNPPPDHPLGRCGWFAPVTLQGSLLTGTWEPPAECEDPSLAGGSVSLRFAG